MNYTNSIAIGIRRPAKAAARTRALTISDRAFHRTVVALTSTSLLSGAIVVGYAAYRLIASA